MRYLLIISFTALYMAAGAATLHVGLEQPYRSIQAALQAAVAGDTILVHKGTYAEGNIVINKAISLFGIDTPVLDGQKKYEVISVRSPDVVIQGFKIIRSGIATLEDPAGIKVYNVQRVQVLDNILDDNFFGIYLQNSSNCKVKGNKLRAYGKQEQEIGNGIHCWKSDSLQIIANTIIGHRDGIYFEFVEHSIVWRNESSKNIRYGLHFMFSGHDSYVANIFTNNGAGVAVMFSKNVNMFNNYFAGNYGEAAYGLLLKELSDGYISGNVFEDNTYALYLEGASRMIIEKNEIKNNGWGMAVQASCMDNTITGNNFIANTFDISTNGSLVLNTFDRNYWDKYEGYDLNRNGEGDEPFRPLSLFSVIAERNPPAMILYRSFMVALIDKSEKLLPSLTPENFIDNKPLMKPLPL